MKFPTPHSPVAQITSVNMGCVISGWWWFTDGSIGQQPETWRRDCVTLPYNVSNPCDLQMTQTLSALKKELPYKISKPSASKIEGNKKKNRKGGAQEDELFSPQFIFNFTWSPLPCLLEKTYGSNKHDPPQTAWSQALISELFGQSGAEEEKQDSGVWHGG